MGADFISNPDQLAALCDRLRRADWIALDTEFMRERTYFARLCLVQVASDEVLACIDPLALESLDPFLDLLQQSPAHKVLHAARQDLEIVHDLRGRLPEPIFDTQIAAALLGHGEQIGYAGLVEAILGHRLPKGHARTDWARRPLRPEQIRYALEDVIHLGPLYRHLAARLRERGRLEWLQAESRALTDPATYHNAPEEAWRRVRGAGRLGGQELAVLATLCAWRETRARERDLPRRWVLDDAIVLELARRQPASDAALGEIEGLGARMRERQGARLLELIREGRALPPEQRPQVARQEPLTGLQSRRLKALLTLIRERAAAVEVAPTLLGTRADAERLARGAQDSPLLRGWRRDALDCDVRSWLEARFPAAKQAPT